MFFDVIVLIKTAELKPGQISRSWNLKWNVCKNFHSGIYLVLWTIWILSYYSRSACMFSPSKMVGEYCSLLLLSIGSHRYLEKVDTRLCLFRREYDFHWHFFGRGPLLRLFILNLMFEFERLNCLCNFEIFASCHQTRHYRCLE